MMLTQAIHRNASLGPEQEATSCRGRRHNWSETKCRIAKLAGAMQQIGVETGDRVAVQGCGAPRTIALRSSAAAGAVGGGPGGEK